MSTLDLGQVRTRKRVHREAILLTILLALAWIALIILLSIAAPLVAPYGYADQQPMLRLRPPAILGHDNPFLFGSDNLGRDVFSRTLYGIRYSIIIALSGTLISTFIGVAMGMLAARLRGWWEETIMMLVDIQASLPFIIFAITIVAFFGKGFWLLAVIVGLAGWGRYARLARGLVLDAETVGYAAALRVLGAGSSRIYIRHILPNIVSALVVQMTLNFPEVILLETGMSFLGLGVQPPLTSLGLLINESRNYLMLAWWMAAVPGAVIVLTTLSISLLGDWLRDVMDTKLR
ncbi:ABC transporter permease [Sinorhizobium chiapasense]|uniref:ABC transporter permease n=1 Tax=Sinorhizobium chiapasense TaxID=501572 RepID=A0ABZ2BFB5_9HYPH